MGQKTNLSVFKSLTIERYELSEAIINQDPKNIEEESGDLLYIFFFMQNLEKKKAFSINTIIEKLIFKLKEGIPIFMET